jgi:hypothetical protein
VRCAVTGAIATAISIIVAMARLLVRVAETLDGMLDYGLFNILLSLSS